jgi:hypothetical protein
MARAPGPGARRLGREQRLRFQGPAARQSLPESRTHVPSSRPQQRLDHPQGGLPAVPSTASRPRASLVACSYKHRVRWSGLKCRGLIPALVTAVNALRSRAVPDDSFLARNGERRPLRRCLAPIRPPLFLSHAMKGDSVFQPSQGTAWPEGDDARRSGHRQRAKAADTSNGHKQRAQAGNQSRHRPGDADAPQSRRRLTGPQARHGQTSRRPGR